MVNSISGIVQSLISNDLSLQSALERGYGNYSAIARMLKPRVEEALGREVELESVITSVKRAAVIYGLPQEDIAGVIAKSVINLRTDVAKVSVEKTRRTLETIRKSLAVFPPEQFIQILEGISTIILIFDQKFFDEIYSMFRKEEITEEKRNLAAIMMQSPREIIDTPGCIAAFYNAISRIHINIEETMSCSTDTIIVLSMNDIGKAFTVLKDLIAEARETISKRSINRS